ncbi:hypothetical protein [Variovorax sp.]|jgi:hypothetical protein|uniref:hypothetical protein n=1 Tax=Variovorax sp. TaxID=1871043 RepID=UPI0011FA4528|nr:hypothetical protein [Variovorax sp.]TAJ67743.1 MAG: hypothetical protein EPO53_02635 [Variovorax sp.]
MTANIAFELLTVEERFQTSDIGLILTPDFPVRDGWKNVEEQVVVVTPVGQKITVRAQLHMMHFKFGVAPTEEQRKRTWRVVVSLPDVDKAAVPVGSRVLVSPAIHRAVLGSDLEPCRDGYTDSK